MGISFKELLVILIIVLILFGAKKIPELAKGLGKGLREFKRAVKETGVDEVKSDIESTFRQDKEEDGK